MALLSKMGSFTYVGRSQLDELSFHTSKRISYYGKLIPASLFAAATPPGTPWGRHELSGDLLDQILVASLSGEAALAWIAVRSSTGSPGSVTIMINVDRLRSG